METIVDPPPLEEPPQQAPSRRLIWILAVLALLSTAAAGLAWSRGADSDAEPVDTVEGTAGEGGHPAVAAPLFRVPTLDGGSFSLSDHLADGGGPVFLNLWASWCPPCRAEMPIIDEAAARHPDVTFIGVAVQDDFQAAARFASEIGVSYTIGLDENDEVSMLYPSAGLPVTFLISAEGNVVEAIYGLLDEARIESSLKHLGQ